MVERRSLARVLLLASLVAVVPLTVSAQAVQKTTFLSGHAAYSRISPPTSGVKLLEDIFLRVRSAPQIAMAKNLYKQQLEMPQQQGPTDYRLAIRPKKLSGKNVANTSPSLQFLPAESSTDSLAAAFGGAGATAGGAAMVASRNEPVAEAWLGNRQFPMVANNSAPSSGVWESPAYNEKQEVVQQKAKDSKESKAGRDMAGNYRPPDLATAVGRLQGLTKQIQDAQSWAEGANIAQGDKMRSTRSNKADTIAYGNDSGAFADEELDTSSLNGKLMQQRQQAAQPSRRAAEQVAAKKKIAPGAPAAAPMAAASREREARSDADNFMVGGKGPKIAMGDIALLPPNVVTGIPLVRLGISERQASGALQAIGSMSQQKVNKWTVWSWNRPQNKNATALQLYMRNGLLDAMRIFDPTLIGSDFGVTLGDSLGKVKERFGEPAFILQEPGPGAGQNYIYPISQIGFQLARPAPGDQPRVVSVLIFNVK